jgi:hypothetical protein
MTSGENRSRTASAGSLVEQAAIFVDAPEPFEKLLTNQVRSAAGRVTSLAPMMTDVTIDSCEDDLSAHLREILSAQISHLGWVVLDQSKGGWTAKGNPGERDLLVQKNGATLSVIEAVVCGKPVTQETMRKDLASHFQKLFRVRPLHGFLPPDLRLCRENRRCHRLPEKDGRKESAWRVQIPRTRRYRQEGFATAGIHRRI